jgi:hypothetical protein
VIQMKSVSAEVNDATASIAYYRYDGRITITINGCTCQFPTHPDGPKANDVDSTIRALTEAVNAL